jgi:hypothetical protein
MRMHAQNQLHPVSENVQFGGVNAVRDCLGDLVVSLWNPIWNRRCHDDTSPTRFDGNKCFRDQTAEQNQDGVKELAVKTIYGDRDQNRVSAHRRRQPFVHRSEITTANTGVWR